jgi:hypothetical protein
MIWPKSRAFVESVKIEGLGFCCLVCVGVSGRLGIDNFYSR